MRIRRVTQLMTITDELLLGVTSTLAILPDIETERGVPCRSLSVHSGEHRALNVLEAATDDIITQPESEVDGDNSASKRFLVTLPD